MNISDKLPEGHHTGEEVLQKLLKKYYNLETLVECRAYMKKPIYKNFSHIDDKKSNPKVFMVAEKNLTAQGLSSRLCFPYKRMRYYKEYGLISLEDAILKDPDGEKPFLRLYEFKCDMFGRKVDVLMAATNGHLLTDDFAKPLRDPADAFVLDIIEKPDDDNDFLIIDDGEINALNDENKIRRRQNQSKCFRDLAAAAAEGSDAVVLWLDNDNAGEKICYEVIELLIDSIKPPPTGNKMDVIYRATFSCATQAKEALRQLGRPNFDKFLGKVLQHHIDLIVGFSFTRVQVDELRAAFPDRDIKDLPFGPCQSATLLMCVNQYLHKEAYHKYVLEITLNANGKKVKAVSAEFENKQLAEYWCQQLQGLNCQVLEEPTKETITVPPPPALCTLKALAFLSKYFQMSPHEAAKILQHLYELGLITYIRTESTKYPSEMFVEDRRGEAAMERLLRRTLDYFNGKYKHEMKYEIFNIDFKKAMDAGIDVKDHPPIMPSFSQPKDNKLNEKEDQVYDFVCSWFFSSFMEDYEYSKETYTFGINGVKFVFVSQKDIFEGFTECLEQCKVETTKEDFSSIFIQGAEFAVESIEVKRSPKSPELLNEHALIEKMEQNRIGTDCSIPEHMYNIARTKYVKVDEKTREYEPTLLGLYLVEAYKECINEPVQPSYRQKFIDHVEAVAAGKKDFVEVYNRYLKEAWKFFQMFKANFNSTNLDLKKFEKCFDRKQPKPKPLLSILKFF